MEKVLLGEVLLFELLRYGLVVGHHRNFRKLDLVLFRAENLVRIDVK